MFLQSLNLPQTTEVTELPHLNLQSFLKDNKQKSQQIDEMIAKKWIECLSSALKYLHEKGITHVNIKSSNMLLFNAVDPKNSKIKFVHFITSLTISPEKLSQKNSSETIAIEDHMNDDLLDLYFLFIEILSITYFL